MFYFRLIRLRVLRLRNKYREVRENRRSRRQAALFVLAFFHHRLGYLCRHILARRVRRRARTAARALATSAKPHVAIKVNGGLGDYVITALYLRDLMNEVEPMTFDLYCNECALAEWVFASIPGFHRAYTEFLFDELKAQYDAALWVKQAVLVYKESGKWRKLQNSPRFCGVVQNMLRFRPAIDILIGDDPKFDNFLARRAVYMNFQRTTFLQGMSKITPGDGRLALATDESIIDTLGLTRGGFVTVHNGFNPDVVTLGLPATKCYPYFDEVVRDIKAKRPELTVLQLGTRTSVPILGVDHNLIGKTNLLQAASLLRHAAWHIDNESGLVHLAHCLGTRSTVVFGPTPIDYFGYQDNQNIPPSACGGCWWINETWMSHCPRGFAAPICMDQDPAVIARSVLDALAASTATPERRLALVQ